VNLRAEKGYGVPTSDRQVEGVIPSGLEKYAINHAVTTANRENSPVEFIGENQGQANLLPTGTNENPGALAGATGAYSKAVSFKTKQYRNRAEAATALCHAIAECDPQDACEIMAAALEDLGSPLPVLLSAMDDARWWASFATPNELKAYALACFEAMCPKVRAAFLGHVQRGAV